MLLQLSPVLLAGLVELVPVGYIPHRLDVQRIHHVGAAPVHATVVEKEIDFIVIAHRGSDLLQEGFELLLVERIVLNLVCENSMAFAYGGTYGLGWLLASAVFDDDILVRPGPCLLLVPTCLEDALVGKDEMTSLLEDLVDFISKLNSHLGVLSV